MILLPIAAAVALLILLIALAKVPPFVAFIVASLAAALLLGLPLAKIPGSIEHGIGDLLGGLAGVILLGAMFGKLIADSGAAQRIAESLIGLFGQKRLPIAMTVTGFIVQRTGSFSQALLLSAGLSLLSAAAYLLLVRQPIQPDHPEIL